jgi:hypothetical protein
MPNKLKDTRMACGSANQNALFVSHGKIGGTQELFEKYHLSILKGLTFHSTDYIEFGETCYIKKVFLLLLFCTSFLQHRNFFQPFITTKSTGQEQNQA